MRKKKVHYSEEKFLEYYYDREAAGEEFGEHLLSCPACGGHYLELERSLDNIKSAFQDEREIHWEAQRQRIMARLQEPEKPAYMVPWRKLAPLTVAILIAVGLIFSLNPGKEKLPMDDYYARLSQDDDLLLREVQNLVNRPLSESLDTINFWMNLAEQEAPSGSLSPPKRRVNNEAT